MPPQPTAPSALAPATSAPSASGAAPQSGRTLKITTTQISDVYGNAKNSTFAVGYTAYLFPAVETLVALTKDGPAPKLAISWEIAPDGKAITFKLRQGVKFHDGTEFNAAAVKWNMEQIVKSKSELKIITSIDALDTYTVKFNLSEYSNTLLHHLTWFDGLMVSPASYQGRDEAYTSTHLVGTGPFEFVSFSRDTNAVFKKNANYWDKGKPYLDGIEYTVVKDGNTARNAFLAGQAQVWDYVEPQYIKDVQAQGYNLNSVPATIRAAFGDSANPSSPFAKKEVRQAVEYAVDKKGLADAFGAGTWEVPIEPASSRHLGFIPNFQGRNYDPAKAKQLLAEAGCPQGFKTTVYNKSTVNSQIIAAV